MPLGRAGIDILAAYLTLNIVAGYGFDKDTGKPSETWTIIGLVVAALVVLALEIHSRRHAPGRAPDDH